MPRRALLVSLALALAAPLGAQDAPTRYDLRRAFATAPRVGARARTATQGDDVQVETTTYASGEPPAVARQEWHHGAAFVDEVRSLGADGAPTCVRRTYTSLTVGGKDVPLTGASLDLVRDEASGKHAFQAVTAEGAPAADVPRLLTLEAKEWVVEQDERAPLGLDDAGILALLLPTDARAVGDAWEVDAARLVPALPWYFPPVDLAPTGAGGRGSLKAVEQVAGRTWLTIEVTLRLPLARLQGHDLAAPTPLEVTLVLRAPADGDGAERTLRQRAHVPRTEVHRYRDSSVWLEFDGTREARTAPAGP